MDGRNPDILMLTGRKPSRESGPAREPALLSARIAARVSRAMHGRKVDVVISAPNLQSLPIHDIARREGELL